jgi:hypothetical protein
MAGRALPRFVVLAVLIASAVALWPEISVNRVDLNDNVFHFTLIQSMVNAIERGANPVDFWSPEWSMGYPVLRTYQPLAHCLVVLVYFALGKTVSLMTVFAWVRYFSVLLLPLTFFASARLLSFAPLEAAAAALLAPLVSTNFLYGMEYGSYVWAGSGLFTQAVASHFLLLAIGFAFQGIRQGRRLALGGVLLGLTFLSHFIYGYIGALTVCLIAVLPDPEVSRPLRIARTAWLGVIAFLLAAFELAPMLRDGGFINHSRWELAWKWDSFGAGKVLQWLFTGDLLDHGRLPVLSLLALAGAGAMWWDHRRTGPVCPAYRFVLYGAVLWVLMFFGRPFWGPLLAVLGVAADMQLHRVIGGAHIFLVLLAALGLSAVWRELGRRWHVAAAVLVTLLLLYPMVRERAQFLANNDAWGHRNLAVYQAAQSSLDTTISKVQQRGGRVYPGLAAGWGGKFKIGDVPFYAFLSQAHVPAVAFLYHSMALTGDLMVRFNEFNPAHYGLFNIRSVVAPAAPGVPLPPFLAPREQVGGFQIFDAPGGGYFDLVDVPAVVQTRRGNFYDINDRWLQSDWVAKKQHLLLDFDRQSSPQLARLSADDALPPAPIAPSAGAVQNERQNDEEYTADLTVARPSFVLFRMTWHPNWKAYIDGRAEATVMLSPGFVGVPVAAGRHRIVCRYQAGPWKGILALSGLLLAVIMWRRGFRPALSAWAGWRPGPRMAIAAGLVALALPVCISVVTTRLPDGHDALEYFPRLEEFHENISHGILFPRWAPDLSRGTGQPFFQFNPPLIYYAAEFWRLAGFDFLTAVNLACVVLALASALSMFLLGRLYFGAWGGWLAATAYLYSPYFSVNLYVRSALAEFAAFPFFALALYGFGAYAQRRKRSHLLLGAAAYGGVLWSHNAAALLFTPLLVAFLAFTAWTAKSWIVLRHQACGFLLGLGLGGCVWLPSLAEREYVGLNRLLQGYLRYTNHFVYLHQLFYSPWGYGISVAGDQDGMSFALGWSHLLLAALAWICIARTGRLADRLWLRFFTVAGALFALLMLEDAVWFWDRVPLLQYVEFPWRLLGPVAVCLALLVAPLGPVLASLGHWRNAGFAAAMALLIVPNLPHNQPKQFRDVDLALWTPQQLALRGIEVTTAAEYVPRWMEAWPAYDPRPARMITGQAEIRQDARTPVSWAGRFQTQGAGAAEMPIAFFPGWEVRVDGLPVPVEPARPTGLIRFQVPAGEHRVVALWTRTPPRLWGDGLSLLSLAVLAVMALGPKMLRSRSATFLRYS